MKERFDPNHPAASGTRWGPADHHTGLSAQTTGVAACDYFLKEYEACATSKIPAAQKATFQGQLDQMRKAWSDAAKAPGAKAILESACKRNSDQMKAPMSAFGCSF